MHLRIFSFLIFALLGSTLSLYGQDDALIRHIDNISTIEHSRAIDLCDSLLEKNPSQRIQGILYRARGRAYYFSGKYDIAAQQYTTSINRLQAGNHDMELGLTFIEQAKLFRKMKMFEEAIHVYGKAEDIFTRMEDSTNLATVWNELGALYEIKEEYRKALPLHRKSLRVRERMNDSVGIAYAHSFISMSELGLNHYETAVTHGLYAMRIFRELGNTFSVALQSADLSALYQKKKDYPKAFAYLDQSDSMASEWNYRDLLSKNHKTRANLYQETGNYDSAFLYHEKYISLRDSLFTENSQQTIAELNARYAVAQKDAEIQKKEKENVRSTFAALFTGLLLLFLGVVSFVVIRSQRQRNRALIKEHFYKEALVYQESEKRLAEQRNHISRELHDNIGSYLTFISSSIDRIESPVLRTNSKILAVKEITQETIIELRKTVWLLNRPAITAFDWQVKLQEYYRRFREVTITATPATEGFTITSEQATHLFRIVQEAINNALKYSGATTIHVVIDMQEEWLHIEVRDNGKGFRIEEISPGFGMTSMRQRTEELQGRFDLESVPGKGTIIRLAMPLKKNVSAE